MGDSRIAIQEDAGEGEDTVVADVNYALSVGVSVEVLAAQDRSSTVGLTLTGNEFRQTLAGTDGADTLNGREGSDVLIGGAGNDLFLFTTSLGSGNVDTISDLAAGDRIALSGGIFSSLGSSFEASEFMVGIVAANAADRVIYNQVTGQLLYDADGNGAEAAILFAQLLPGTGLTAASFEVIAPT